MDKQDIEDTIEEIEDATNILQLLVQELVINQDDPHIIRSIGIVLKILDSALQHMQKD